MRQAFISHTLEFITSNNKNLTEEEIEKLHYGLESLYIILTKFTVLFILTSLLGILKDFLLILVFFNLLRYPAFGFHAGNSFLCFFLSTLLFVGLPYLFLQIEITNPILYILLGISVICFVLFAPADTEKRPLTNRKKRKIRKIVATTLVIIYAILIISLQHTIWAKYLLIAVVLETIALLPSTYWIFGQSYRNYKKLV